MVYNIIHSKTSATMDLRKELLIFAAAFLLSGGSGEHLEKPNDTVFL